MAAARAQAGIFEVIPAIDLLEGSAVRLTQGRYDAATVYDRDPASVAARFVAAGARRVHVVDLEGAKAGRPVQGDAVKRILAAAGDVPVQMGGGLRTLEGVDVFSYQKQIIGREISAGVFSFWDSAVIDVSAGGRSMEPVQLAVRSLIERAVLEFSSTLYGVEAGSVCRFDDPLGPTNETGGVNTHTAYATGAEIRNVQARQSVDRGHERRDPDVRAGLRGRYN